MLTGGRRNVALPYFCRIDGTRRLERLCGSTTACFGGLSGTEECHADASSIACHSPCRRQPGLGPPVDCRPGPDLQRPGGCPDGVRRRQPEPETAARFYLCEIGRAHV